MVTLQRPPPEQGRPRRARTDPASPSAFATDTSQTSRMLRNRPTSPQRSAGRHRGGDMAGSAALREDAHAMQGELVQLRHRFAPSSEVGLQLRGHRRPSSRRWRACSRSPRQGADLGDGGPARRPAEARGAPARRHGRAAGAGGEGFEFHAARSTGDARLRSRPAHRDARGRGPVLSAPRRACRGRGVHVQRVRRDTRARGICDRGRARRGRHEVSSAYGMHVMSSAIPWGSSLPAGPADGCVDELRVVVRGAGRHGSARTWRVT